MEREQVLQLLNVVDDDLTATLDCLEQAVDCLEHPGGVNEALVWLRQARSDAELLRLFASLMHTKLGGGERHQAQPA